MPPRSTALPRVRRRRVAWATWLGFLIVIVGWAVLVLDMLISNGALKPGNLVDILSLRADILTIAQTAITSGFALAIFGAVQSGFGALTSFFDAVLQRSTEPRPRPVEPAVAPIEPQMPMARPAVRDPAPTWSPASPARSPERNYVIRPDGSVEVETMFGTRLFATLDEARDFIR